LKDQEIKGNLSETERSKLESVCDNTVKWIETNSEVEVEDYNRKQKEIEQVCSPTIFRTRQQDPRQDVDAEKREFYEDQQERIANISGCP